MSLGVVLNVGVPALLFVWLLLRVLRIGSRTPGLPPGPPTVPLLGNAHMFPGELAHLR